VQAAREAARRAQCSNNLKQLALAMHSFHEARGRLPEGASGCCWGTWMMRLLPYTEGANLLDPYENLGGFGFGTPTYASVNNLKYITSRRLAVATCPSDVPEVYDTSPLTKHNYAANYGNTGLDNVSTGDNYTPRAEFGDVIFGGSPFAWRKIVSGKVVETPVSFADITDGTSSTLLLAEAIQSHGADGRGLTWWGDAAGFSTYKGPNTSQPDTFPSAAAPCDPAGNNPPCVPVSDSVPEMFFARSRHPGGVEAALCDGSVRFVSDSIDINIWRSLGTSRGGEAISGDY
jgi:hypothetical protein